MTTPRFPARIDAILEALPQAIAITLLAGLPAFINLATERIFEEEKALLVRAAALIALPGVLIAWRRHGGGLRRRPIVLAFAALTAALLAATLFGIEPRRAFEGAYLRRHGTATWLALGVMFAAMCTSALTSAGRARLLAAIAIGSLCPSIYLLLQGAGIDPIVLMTPSADFSAGSTFGNRVFIGGYLATVIPLTAILISRSPAWAVLLAVQIAALVASGSRGALVALGAAAVVAAATIGWARLSRRRFALVLALCVGAAVAGAVPARRLPAVARAFDPAIGSARVRVLTWKGVIALMRDSGGRISVGYGPESLSRVFLPFYAPEIGRLEHIDAMPDRAHNELLDTLVSAGVVGVALELTLFAAVVAGALRLRDVRLRTALAAASVAHIVEIQFGIATVVTRLTFLAIAAVIAGLEADEPAALLVETPRRASAGRARDSRTTRARVTTPSAAWLLLPAAVSAASPLVATIPARLGPSAAAGTRDELVMHLTRLSFTTPLLYLTMIGAAVVLAWSLADDAPPPRARTWLQGLTVLVCVIAASRISIEPSRADVMSQTAAGFEDRQQWPAAVVAYGEASRIEPRTSHYAAGLGRALMMDAMPLAPDARGPALAAARAALERAREIDPYDLDRTRQLASLLRVQAWGREGTARSEPLEAADHLYAQVTRLAPAVPPLWIEWAHVDLDRERVADAVPKVARAMALDDSRVDAWLLRGRLHEMQHGDGDALADYDAALSRDPHNVDALRGRTVALVHLDRVDEALATVGEALTVAPGNADLLRLRAAIEGSRH